MEQTRFYLLRGERWLMQSRNRHHFTRKLDQIINIHRRLGCALRGNHGSGCVTQWRVNLVISFGRHRTEDSCSGRNYSFRYRILLTQAHRYQEEQNATDILLINAKPTSVGGQRGNSDQMAQSSPCVITGSYQNPHNYTSETQARDIFI
jgi:hypothetical protein